MLMIVASEVRFKKFLARSARQPSRASSENCFILFTREHGSSQERHEQGGYYVLILFIFGQLYFHFAEDSFQTEKITALGRLVLPARYARPLKKKSFHLLIRGKAS